MAALKEAQKKILNNLFPLEFFFFNLREMEENLNFRYVQ